MDCTSELASVPTGRQRDFTDAACSSAGRTCVHKEVSSLVDPLQESPHRPTRRASGQIRNFSASTRLTLRKVMQEAVNLTSLGC